MIFIRSCFLCYIAIYSSFTFILDNLNESVFLVLYYTYTPKLGVVYIVHVIQDNKFFCTYVEHFSNNINFTDMMVRLEMFESILY